MVDLDSQAMFQHPSQEEDDNNSNSFGLMVICRFWTIAYDSDAKLHMDIVSMVHMFHTQGKPIVVFLQKAG